MKARAQLALLRLSDPRLVRVVVLGVALALTAISAGGAEAVLANPTQGGSGGTVGG